eukprot:TRINITY_DN2175_c0_g1_i6.p1 TRINITY_DN2175_c0_g1~~TRINITY_DN2175_c0_g1_i6.p1  ORF type:complete len:175 (+),score=26.95 TRINITY_DN2175_c0_g1_i6:47-526(+)
MPEYETYSVEITQQTGTIVPLQLKHLGIDKEYKEVVGGIVEDVREMYDATTAWYLMVPCFLFCTVPYMMAKAISLNKKLRTSMQEKCEKANASPNVSGRAQFTLAPPQPSRRRPGARHPQGPNRCRPDCNILGRNRTVFGYGWHLWGVLKPPSTPLAPP